MPSLSDSLKGAAKQAYEQGRILYTDGDNAGALIKFKLAYKTSKDPRLLWNMAVCDKNLRHYAKAQDLVEQYLSDGEGVLTDRDRQVAVSVVQAIKAYVATLTINVDQSGAAIIIDGTRVGTSPLSSPVRVDVGQRKITISKKGYKIFQQTLVVPGGSPMTLTAKLQQVVHQGQLRVVTDMNGRIEIDGRYVGRGHWSGKLSSGDHVIGITAPGKKQYQDDVTISDGQLQVARVTLEDKQKPQAVVQSSGVPTWLWVAGGVVLAAGLGTGGYFLLKPQETTPSASAGSMDPGIVHVSFRR